MIRTRDPGRALHLPRLRLDGRRALTRRARARRRIPGVELAPGLVVGPSPGRRGLERLARAGFRAVIDLDLEGEAGQPLSPNVEATWAHTFELQHFRFSLYAPPQDADIERFLALVHNAPRPTYVHSIVRDRALAFAALAWAAEAHMSAPQLLSELAQRNLGFASEEWTRFLSSHAT